MRRAVICMLSLAVALFAPGCIRVSKSAEVVDCALAFVDAVSSGDLSAIADLTFNRPSGWEMAIAGAESVWHGFSVVEAHRPGDQAPVSIELELAQRQEQELGLVLQETGLIDEPGDLDLHELHGDYSMSERLTWVIELRRIEGQWFVDLGRTLGVE